MYQILCYTGFMKTFINLVSFIVSILLVGSGLFLVIDSSLQSVLGHAASNSGNLGAWQSAVTGFILTTMGGNLANATYAALDVNE